MVRRQKLKKIAYCLLCFVWLIAGSQADEQNAWEKFQEVVEKVSSLKDCQVKFRSYSSTGKLQPLYLYTRQSARYIREPALYYQKRLEVKANYKEQAQAGFQEIYRGDMDLIEILMPGAFRALGLIKIFPEDPKATGMNGGSLKSMAPWDALNGFSRMAKLGSVELKDATLNGKPALMFEITQRPGTFYYGEINRVRLYVEPESLLPKRFEQYSPDTTEPMSWLEWDDMEVNTGLAPEQIKFEGFKSPFSMVSTPSAKDVEPLLKPIIRKRLSEHAPEAKSILVSFNQAVDGIKSYRADLRMSFRYLRLRLYREDRFAYNRKPYWFMLVTEAQKANYLLLNHSAGAQLWIDPKDNNFHLIGGGVQKLLGEQVFSSSDYKFYSSLGDNPYELDFIKLQSLIQNHFDLSSAQACIVDYEGKKMYEIKLLRAGEVPPRHPGKINLIIDPELNLPRAIEFSAYDDPKAYMAMTIDNLRLNIPLKPTESKF